MCKDTSSEKEYNCGKEWSDYLKLARERPDIFVNSDHISIIMDKETIIKYEQQTGKRIGVIYHSAYNILVVDLVRDMNGNIFTYERIIPSVNRGAVVIMTKDKDKFVLLKQYRHALRDYQYGFPRGFGESGITVIENARKEVAEELNATINNITFLGEVVADSGLCGNKVAIFMCEVEGTKLKYGYEGIDEIIMLSENEISEWICQGKINDGYTLAAYAQYRARELSIVCDK